MSLLSPPPPPPSSLLITSPYGSGSDTVGSISIGSYGPLIAVLVVIAVLIIASLVFAQLCVRSGVFVNTVYDRESFVDQECGMRVGEGTLPPVKEDDNEGAASEELDELEELEVPQNEDVDKDSSSQECV
jgi:hypothetical protein